MDAELPVPVPMSVSAAASDMGGLPWLEPPLDMAPFGHQHHHHHQEQQQHHHQSPPLQIPDIPDFRSFASTSAAPFPTTASSPALESAYQGLAGPPPPWPSMLIGPPPPGSYPSLTAPLQQPLAPPPSLPLSNLAHAPLSSPPLAAPAPTPRRVLTDADRRNMCLFQERHPHVKQTEIGGLFGVERSTVSKVLRQKDKYLFPDTDSSPLHRARGKFPDIERALSNWVRNHQRAGGPQLSDAMIREKAIFFAHSVGVGALPDGHESLLTPTWLARFKKKNSLADASPDPPASDPSARSPTPTSTLSPTSSTPAPASPRLRRESVDSSGHAAAVSASAPPPLASPAASLWAVDNPFAVGPSLRSTTPASGMTSGASAIGNRSSAECVTDCGEPARKRNRSVPDVPPLATAASLPSSMVSISMQPPPLPASASMVPTPSSSSTSTSTSASSLATPSTTPTATTISPTASSAASSSPFCSFHPAVTSPTQEEARRALALVMDYFQAQPTGLAAQEYMTIGKLMERLELVQGQDGFAGMQAFGMEMGLGRKLEAEESHQVDETVITPQSSAGRKRSIDVV